MSVRVLVGDALTVLRTLPSESVQCVVTSPPYFGLRSYSTDPQVWGGDPEHGHVFGTEGRVVGGSQKQGATSQRNGRANVEAQVSTGTPTGAFCPCGAWRGELGSEPTPALFIEHLVSIFDEVGRVLRPDGLCFVNLGDSYSGSGKGPTTASSTLGSRNGKGVLPTDKVVTRTAQLRQGFHSQVTPSDGIPAKNLLLVPQRFAIAMQDRGWWVRQEIAWCKRAPMPESVIDRFTSAWEPVYMLSKAPRYYFDQEANRQPVARTWDERNGPVGRNGLAVAAGGQRQPQTGAGIAGANMRNYWLLSPEPSGLNHYASYPTELVRRCILAGSRKGDTVLDPFGGSGTTGLVADRLDRDAILIELNPTYADMARRRIEADAGPMLADVAVETPAQVSMFGEAV